MKLLKESLIEIKKSKFIGLCYEISSIEEAKEIIEQLKKEHKKARHIPYAYKVNNTAKKTHNWGEIINAINVENNNILIALA